MEAVDLFSECGHCFRLPFAWMEEGARVADYAGHVPDEFVRRSDGGAGAKVGEGVGRVAEGLLGAIGDGGEEVFQQRVLGVHRAILRNC